MGIGVLMSIIEMIDETWHGGRFAEDSANWAATIAESGLGSIYRSIYGDVIGFFTISCLEHV